MILVWLTLNFISFEGIDGKHSTSESWMCTWTASPNSCIVHQWDVAKPVCGYCLATFLLECQDLRSCDKHDIPGKSTLSAETSIGFSPPERLQGLAALKSMHLEASPVNGRYGICSFWFFTNLVCVHQTQHDTSLALSSANWLLFVQKLITASHLPRYTVWSFTDLRPSLRSFPSLFHFRFPMAGLDRTPMSSACPNCTKSWGEQGKNFWSWNHTCILYTSLGPIETAAQCAHKGWLPKASKRDSCAQQVGWSALICEFLTCQQPRSRRTCEKSDAQKAMSWCHVLRASPCDWPTGAVGDHRCHAVGNVMLKVPCPAKKCFADLQMFQCFALCVSVFPTSSRPRRCPWRIQQVQPQLTQLLSDSVFPPLPWQSLGGRPGRRARHRLCRWPHPPTGPVLDKKKGQNRYGMLPKMNKDDCTVTTICYN